MDGINKQNASKKLNATSLTVSTKSLLITTAIDASDNQNTAIFDIPVTFLTTYMDKDVIIVLEVYLTKIMVSISTITCRQYVSIRNNGRKIIYVRLHKVLCSFL